MPKGQGTVHHLDTSAKKISGSLSARRVPVQESHCQGGLQSPTLRALPAPTGLELARPKATANVNSGALWPPPLLRVPSWTLEKQEIEICARDRCLGD